MTEAKTTDEVHNRRYPWLRFQWDKNHTVEIRTCLRCGARESRSRRYGAYGPHFPGGVDWITKHAECKEGTIDEKRQEGVSS